MEEKLSSTIYPLSMPDPLPKLYRSNTQLGHLNDAPSVIIWDIIHV